jgi:hypothetical protein
MTTPEREDLLNKLQRLLEMTEKNGCTEAEAGVAAIKAQALMDKHGLSLKDLKAASPTDVCANESVVAGKKKTHEVQFCCPVIAEFTGTRAWSDRKGDCVLIQFYGIANDVSIAVYLFKTFRAAMDFEWTRSWSHNSELTDLHAKTVRRSFMTGMYRRLNERLKTLIKERENNIDRQYDSRSIVLVKEELVERGFGSLGLKLHSGKHRRAAIRDSGAFKAGQDAGGRVGIDHGRLE